MKIKFIFFNELLKTGRPEDIEFVIPIKMFKYADSLNQTGNYKKALMVLEELDEDLENVRNNGKFYKQYKEGNIFLKGVCLGRLKKFKESNLEFRKLLFKHPNNDRYIDWYKANKENLINSIFNKLMFLGLLIYVTMLITSIFGYRYNNFLIKDLGLLIVIVSFMISFIWRMIIRKKAIKVE